MAEDDEISIDFSKITGFFKRKKKDEITEEKEKIKELKTEEAELKSEEKEVKKEIKEEQKKLHDIEKSNPEDDTVAIDFGKIKGFFKGLGKESSKSHQDSDEELSIDFARIKTFLIKYQLPLLLVLVLVLQLVPNQGYLPWGGIWMRMQTQNLPQADDWAANSINNYVKAQVKQAVDKDYPNLPDKNKEKIITEQLDKLMSEQKAQIDQQKTQIAQQLRSQFQYEYEGNTYTYMPDIDPYTYLRYARNLLEKGQYYDELKDGQPWDNHMVAPLGAGTGFTLHNYVLAYIYKVMHMFNSKISLMQAANYFPVIFVFLALIPAFFIGRRFAGNVGGIFTATMTALSTAAFGRTPWGHADTDAYNMFFPMLIVWLFVEAFSAKTNLKKYGLFALTGLSMGIYSIAWGGGWWYLFDFMAASLGVYFIYQLYVYRKEIVKNINIFKTPALKDIILAGIVFVVASGIFVSAFAGFGTFIGAFKAPLGFTIIKAAAHPTLWPNVYTTVAELNPASIQTVIDSMGGKFLFAIAALGILLMMLKKDEHGKYDLKYSILLTIWFIGTIYASTKGVRFTLLLAPAFSVAFGVALGILYEKITVWFEKGLHVKKYITGPVLIVLFALLFIAPVKADIAQAKGDIPIMNDAWWNALTAIKDASKPDAIINSWWDFGHHFKYIADRAVTFDGASQNTPMAHWIGHVLLTGNEDEAVGILRMLDCGSNTAFEKLLKENNDSHKSIDLIYKIIVLDKKEAAKELEKAKIKNADEVLKYTHCTPPENYFITSDDMIGKAGVWAHFGGWDFEKADIWMNLRSLPKDEMIDEMKKKFGYDDEKAEKMYDEVEAISTETDANNWISPWPGYPTGIAGCHQDKNEIICDNGLTVNTEDLSAKLKVQQGEGIPQSLVYVNQNKTFSEKTMEGANIPYSAILIPAADGYQSLLADPLLAKSMFTRMFFMDGHGLKHFELFNEQRQVTGGMIYVWKVNWEGTKPRVHRTLVEKTIVSKGDKVTADYIGWLADGTVFDSSIKDWKDKNITKDSTFSGQETNPLGFEVGAGKMIKGFDAAVVGMKPGETKTIKIKPEDAYGTDPNAHPLGNKTLNFKVKVESIK